MAVIYIIISREAMSFRTFFNITPCGIQYMSMARGKQPCYRYWPDEF